MAALAPGPGEEDLRGFEWHYLEALGRPSPHRVILQADQNVYTVAVRPDGKLVAVAVEKVLRQIDPATGADLHPPLPHPADVSGVAFAADGKAFATACKDGVVRYWRDAEAVPVECHGHDDRVSAVLFTPDGRLVSAGWDRTVRMWDVVAVPPTGRVMVTTKSAIGTVAWAPDGRHFATGEELDAAGIVKVWDPDDGRLIAALPEHISHPAGVTFTASDHLVVAGRNGVVIGYHRAGRNAIHPWEAVVRFGREHDRIKELAVSGDGTRLAVARDSAVEVWATGTGEIEAVYRGHAGRVWTTAFGPDGHTVWSGGADGTVRMWEAAAGLPLHRLPVRESVGWLAFDHTGRRLAVGTDGPIRPFDLTNGRPTAADSLHPPHPTHAGGYATRGDLILTTTRGGVFRARPNGVLDPQPGTLRADHAPWFGRHQLAVSPDGGWAVGWSPPEVRAVGPDGVARPAIRLDESVHAVAVGRDGRVAAACFDETVRLVDADTGRVTANLSCGSEKPRVVTVSLDGRRVAAGCGAVTLVWNCDTTISHARLVGHRGPVRALTFSPDGGTVATGGEDGTVRLWRADTGIEVAAYNEHGGPIDRLAFSADGRRLASSGPHPQFPGESLVVVRDCGQSFAAVR